MDILSLQVSLENFIPIALLYVSSVYIKKKNQVFLPHSVPKTKKIIIIGIKMIEVEQNPPNIELSVTDITCVTDNYALGTVSSVEKLSSGYANINYKIITNDRNYLYRVCRQHSLENIQYELRLMKVLKKMAFPTAYPVRRRDGEYISKSPEGNVLLFDFIEGDTPVINSRVTADIARAVGQLNACDALEGLNKKNEINAEACNALISRFDTSKNQYPDIFEYFGEQTHYLSAILQENIPKGLVHADIFPDNTLFVGDKLQAIIDFEEACIDHLLFDVGMTINGFAFINNQLDNEKLLIFLKEYNQIRPLTRKEYELLPYYIQWAAHGMLSWHLKYDLLNTAHPVQLDRARELMSRVKEVRKKESEIFSLINNEGNGIS